MSSSGTLQAHYKKYITRHLPIAYTFTVISNPPGNLNIHTTLQTQSICLVFVKVSCL